MTQLSKNDVVRVTTTKCLVEKNRVREHGDLWVVEQPFGVLRAWECLLKSQKTGHLRWWDHDQVRKVET